jgi:hypothetical protein
MARVKIGQKLAWAPGRPAPWTSTAGSYVSGRAQLDEMDLVAIEMERKWGADRLRLLVDPEWREKFDRQRFNVNKAVTSGELGEVIEQAKRMIAAWRKLDALAEGSSRAKLPPTVWEIALNDGTVVQIVREAEMADKLAREDSAGRKKIVFTLDEIAKLLGGAKAIREAKMNWPGAEVTAVREKIHDPLMNVHDTYQGLDDPIPEFDGGAI